MRSKRAPIRSAILRYFRRCSGSVPRVPTSTSMLCSRSQVSSTIEHLRYRKSLREDYPRNEQRERRYQSFSGLRQPESELSSAVDPGRFQSPKETSKNRPRSCLRFDHSWSLSLLIALSLSRSEVQADRQVSLRTDIANALPDGGYGNDILPIVAKDSRPILLDSLHGPVGKRKSGEARR